MSVFPHVPVKKTGQMSMEMFLSILSANIIAPPPLRASLFSIPPKSNLWKEIQKTSVNISAPPLLCLPFAPVLSLSLHWFLLSLPFPPSSLFSLQHPPSHWPESRSGCWQPSTSFISATSSVVTHPGKKSRACARAKQMHFVSTVQACLPAVVPVRAIFCPVT